MTDVFVSYERSDKTLAERFANCVEGEGWACGWDAALEAGFRTIHTHSLVDWNGARDSDPFRRLARQIGKRLGRRTEDSGSGEFDLPEHQPRLDEARATAPTAKTLPETDLVQDEHEPVAELAPTDDPPPEAGALKMDIEPEPPARAAALRHLRESVQEAERNASAPGKDLQLLGAVTQLADYLGKSGNHAEAIQEYERAQQIASLAHSSDWKSRINRGLARCLTGLGRHDEAIEHLAEASDDAADQYALVMMIFRAIDEVVADQSTSAETDTRLVWSTWRESTGPCA